MENTIRKCKYCKNELPMNAHGNREFCMPPEKNLINRSAEIDPLSCKYKFEKKKIQNKRLKQQDEDYRTILNSIALMRLLRKQDEVITTKEILKNSGFNENYYDNYVALDEETIYIISDYRVVITKDSDKVRIYKEK